ncbi:unnamed protein product [Dibothriocephalus latus]|uniref:Uncharacterized protein n=1 Tax=Dibothriocephalus latus TaxID=60516 RepID=A0A3P7MA08_DIBLA|nr:unnamed protein product [Dibothriocephalus latus]
MSPAPDVLANECGASPRAPASSRDEAKKLTVPVSMSAVAVARKVSTNENAAACFGRHISNRPTASPFNKFFGTDVQVARPPLTRAAELHTCIHFFLRIMHLTECEDCHVCKQSVRQWTSHLVAQHTLPSEWPSERASRLPADSVQTPYTYVTESRKKRKPGTIPRPLNSFMVSSAITS